MPSYVGIGTSITHNVEVDGNLFLQDIEGGPDSTRVPLEIFSNLVSSSVESANSRMLRLRVQNYGETDTSNSYVTDMGIRGDPGKDYFFITAPQNTSNVGDQNTFVISKTSNVGIGTDDPVVKLDVTGSSVDGKSLQLRSGDINSGTDSSQIIFSYDGNPYNSGGYAHSIRTRHNSNADSGNAIDFWLWNTSDTADSNTLGNKRVMTIEGNGNVGIGLTNPSFKLHVYAADDDTAIVAATGGVQGTGVFYVGQSTAYGGGIAYNGDGTPDWDGSGSDYISLFRRDNNVNYWTARNFYNSNNWEFRGYISHQNPIFYAYISGSGPASSNYVTYDQTYVNVGSNYNIANGVFTCPVAGIYTFTWGAIGNNSSTIYRYYIRKNNVNVGDTHLRLDTKSTSSNDYGIGQRSVTFSLSFNDTIRIYYISENGTSDYGNQYTYFQGQLISTN